jgi:multidrug resistance efflux pump
MIDLQGGWIVAWFRENQIENVHEGDAGEVVLDVLPGRVWPVRVASFSGGINTVNQAAPPGGLVDTPPQNTWLSEPQRFAVRLEFDPPNAFPRGVRLGSQATVLVYTPEAEWLRPLWKIYIRFRALMSYVY